MFVSKSLSGSYKPIGMRCEKISSSLGRQIVVAKLIYHFFYIDPRVGRDKTNVLDNAIFAISCVVAVLWERDYVDVDAFKIQRSFKLSPPNILKYRAIVRTYWVPENDYKWRAVIGISSTATSYTIIKKCFLFLCWCLMIFLWNAHYS